MIFQKSTSKILLSILKYVGENPTIADLSEAVNMTHVGLWKVLKKLQTEKMIVLKHANDKKNSVFTILLDWSNPLVEKTLSLALEQEAATQRRWYVNFADLKSSVDFLVLYGSILSSPQNANDIDILYIVSKKESFLEIDKKIANIQKTQLKKIHAIDFSSDELKEQLNKPNIAFINAIKEGVVLFGQDKYIKFIRGIKK